MTQRIYKSVDLFGNEQIHILYKTKNKPDLFHNHEAFVEKFDQKKTTDDCYTPKDVYDVVLNYVNQNYNLSGLNILRPFFPNGDYRLIDYGDKSVVIDNPPFSILAEILRFYTEKKVKFFLFAPHLTLFSNNCDCTAIVTGGSVVYENGAVVKTSFLSNLFGDVRILGAPHLLEEMKKINEANNVNLPKYDYPNQVLTVSQVQKLNEIGIPFKVLKGEAQHCRGLDSQKRHKKAIFGSGFLLSEKAAAEKAAAEKAAAEKAAAEKDHKIIWELSARELEIIKSLQNNNK